MGRLEFFVPRETLPENRGLLVLLTGPTGVGKDLVLNNLTLPHQQIITFTTRYKGPNEVDGVDYHFTTTDKFEAMIEKGEMLEYYCNPRGNYYGTSKTEIAAKRNGGLVVWRLNPDGVSNLLGDPEKIKILQPTVVICLVADLDILAKRLGERGREKGLLVIERVKQAHEENEMIAARFEAIYDERIFFQNGTGWVDNQELVPKSRVAVQVIENRQGLDNPDGFPRTMRLIEETIVYLNNDLWRQTKA